MDYEKAYKEALERAKNLYSGVHKGCKEVIENVFPELAETEDERIRKCLIEGFKNYNESFKTFGGMEVSDIVAWLEKQKEQEDDEDDFTIYHPLKNGEGKYECIPYSFYGSLTSFSDDKDLMDFLNESFYDKEECERWCERENISDLPECKHKIKKDSAFDYLCDNEKQKDIDAIKKDWFERGKKEVMTVPELYGLQKKEQKPAEWSEEDVRHLYNIIFAVNNTYKNNMEQKVQLISWLKSLRPQPRWKPSEEQMRALRKAVKKLAKTDVSDSISLSLMYDDLMERM